MVRPTTEEIEVIHQIEKVVCSYLLVDQQEIVNRNKTSQVSLARGYIFYILHVDRKISINKIANFYFREKRVVFWNVSKIKFLIKQRIYKDIYEKICEIISK